MPSSPRPSPMAINRSSPQPSMFKKRSEPQMAASYLTAVLSNDARAKVSSRAPTATPALSLSSSVTSSSEDTILYEMDESENNEDGLAHPRNPPNSEQVFSTSHLEFGHCANEQYRYTSQHVPGAEIKEHVEQEPPYYILLSTYISYLILICLGHMRDFFGKYFSPKSYGHLMPRDGYAPLNSDFDSFYTRRLKKRMDECFSQPTTGVAGRTIMLVNRKSEDNNATYIPTGDRTRVLNISSYNYLGFAQASGGCADAVEESIKRYGISSCGSRLEGGTTDLHVLGERLVARFIGTEDALISSMGFATNSTIIPALVNKGCLVISDELNHASIRFGVRLSGANVRMFKHNDMGVLETLLKEVISQGQPKTHRPWKKILVIVEGLYSMEGTLAPLPILMELKKKYKFYLFVDEAHSIGAMGPNGRGVADFFGVNPREIDVLMGTFTKSFGAAGGYIGGNKSLIDRLRVRGHSGAYAESVTPSVLTQVVASMSSIMGISQTETIQHPGPATYSSLPPWLTSVFTPAMVSGAEGRMRLRRIAFNSRYLAFGLKKLGFITYGHPASPVVPLLLYNPGKLVMFHRLMKQRKTPIVVVVVGYPATALVTSRVRFCVSSSHTKEDMDTILEACDEVGDLLDLKHGCPRSERWSIKDITERTMELISMED